MMSFTRQQIQPSKLSSLGSTNPSITLQHQTQQSQQQQQMIVDQQLDASKYDHLKLTAGNNLSFSFVFYLNFSLFINKNREINARTK